MTAWVFLDDVREGVELPVEWVNRGQFYLPALIQSSITIPQSSIPIPAPARVYRKVYPTRFEYVTSKSVTVRRGEPMSGRGATKIPYVTAVVFERI